MAIPHYPIVHVPAPILSQPATKVTEFGKPLEAVIKRMIPTMRDAIGIGLAANQVGLPMALAVIEYQPLRRDERKDAVPVHAIVNPEILSYGTELDEVTEGCLSCPGIELPIRRATSIELRYQTPDGTVVEQTVRGFPARIYQHEIDHLNGKLILDRTTKQRALVAAYRANPQPFIDEALRAAKQRQ